MAQNTTASVPALTKQNVVDKVIAYLAPDLAVRRQAARNQLALSGGYTGARIDRASLIRWIPAAGSPTTDIIRDLHTLRARSRDQMRNAPVAVGAHNTTVTSAIGSGLSCSPAINARRLRMTDEQAEAWQEDVKLRFETWASSPDCDVERKLDFYGLQELAFRSFLESGDTFVLTPRVVRASRAAQLALQLIEADRVCNPNRSSNSDTVVDGMECNPESGEVVACHVARRHPADGVAANQWDRVPLRGEKTGRRNVLHIMKPLRPGQRRGVPWIAPILEPLKQLGRWTDAELNAAVVSSLMTTFVKMDSDAFQDLYDEDAQGLIVDKASKWSGEMESGKVVNLLPGEDITSPTPGRPNPAFDPFWTAMVRQVGMALGIPFEVLVMHFQSSYSAARGALLMAWKVFMGWRNLVVKTLCQPVYELWLADEVAEGRIAAAGFFVDPVTRAAWCGAVWTGDGPGSIDPVKEVTAAEKRIDLGISTKQAESIAFDGVDWDSKHRQRVKETNAEKRDGIYSAPAGTAPVAPTEPDADEAGKATQDAIAALGARIDVLLAKPPTITVHTPPVEVRAGDVHVAAPSVQVSSAPVSVVLPEGCITLEATVEAPQVHNHVEPSEVLVTQRGPDEQIHERDAAGNLVKTINVYRTK